MLGEILQLELSAQTTAQLSLRSGLPHMPPANSWKTMVHGQLLPAHCMVLGLLLCKLKVGVDHLFVPAMDSSSEQYPAITITQVDHASTVVTDFFYLVQHLATAWTAATLVNRMRKVRDTLRSIYEVATYAYEYRQHLRSVVIGLVVTLALLLPAAAAAAIWFSADASCRGEVRDAYLQFTSTHNETVQPKNITSIFVTDCFTAAKAIQSFRYNEMNIEAADQCGVRALSSGMTAEQVCQLTSPQDLQSFTYTSIATVPSGPSNYMLHQLAAALSPPARVAVCVNVSSPSFRPVIPQEYLVLDRHREAQQGKWIAINTTNLTGCAPPPTTPPTSTWLTWVSENFVLRRDHDEL